MRYKALIAVLAASLMITSSFGVLFMNSQSPGHSDSSTYVPDSSFSLFYGGVTPNEVYLYWDATQYVLFSEYEVQVSKDGGGSWNTVQTISSQSQTNYFYNDGSPSATYDFQVLSVGNDGSSTSTSSIATVPFKASSVVSYSTISSTEISLSWTNNAYYGDGVGFIDYQVMESVNGGSFTAIDTITSVDTLTYDASNMNPGSTYSFYIVTNNGWSGTSPPSYPAPTDSNTVTYSVPNQQYTVTFTESGLSGQQWSVTFDGQSKSTTSSSLSFTVSPGQYSYSVSPPSGYTANPSSGSISVSGDQTVGIQFSYGLATVTFSESGIGTSATGTVLTVDGTAYDISQLPISFSWAIGSSHSFQWGTTVSQGSSEEYVWDTTSGLSSQESGSVTVPSGGGKVSATYSPFYQITFSVNPYNYGTFSWSGGGNVGGSTGTSYSSNYYYAGQQISISAQPSSSSYQFTGWTSTSGISLGSTTSSSTTATVRGVGTVTADFSTTSASAYTVTFTESGLSGQQWSVTFDGQSKSTTSSSLSFTVSPGQYSYSVSPPSGYTANPSSGSISVSGDQTVGVTLQLLNWEENPAFSVSSTSVQMGETSILGSEYVWSSGLADNPTQFFVVTQSPGYTQNAFDNALSEYFGITVPSGYEPKMILIMNLPLINDLNAIGGTYSVKTYEADFTDILPSNLFDGNPYIETTSQGNLQLAMTLSASTNYVGITSSLLNLIDSIAGISVDNLAPVKKAPSNQIVEALVSALELITTSVDITITDITEPLSSNGHLTSYTFLDLYKLSNILSSSIHVGKLFKTFLDVIYFGQKFAENGLISTATFGIALVDDLASISSLVQLSFSSASLAAQLFSYIFPQYNSNTLLSAIESGVEYVAGFVDPNGTTIEPSLVINRDTTIGYNLNNDTFVSNSTGNYAVYIGSSYYFFLRSGGDINTELRMNVVNGTSTVPYFVNAISMSETGNLTTIAGEAFDGSTPLINMTVSTNGSISQASYIVLYISINHPTVAPNIGEIPQSNPELLNVSVRTFLSNGDPVKVEGINIVSGNETIPMYSLTSSDYYYLGMFNNNVTYSVYVNSAQYPGGYGTFTTSQATPSNVTKSPVFVHSYTVTFEEHGLTSGLEWGITIGSNTNHSRESLLEFSLTNGTYTYNILSVKNYSINSTSGTFTIKGENVTIQVDYAELNVKTPPPTNNDANTLYNYIFVAILLTIIVFLTYVMNKRRRN
jgi:hypothetical protein